MSVCFFRPSDGKVLQLPEARIYLSHGRIEEPRDAVYFEPVDLACFPNGACPLLTRIPHIVKLRLTPAVDDASGAVVWSLGLLVARVDSRDAPNDGPDEAASEHPFEIGIDLSSYHERASYDDESVGTMPEVFDVARWV